MEFLHGINLHQFLDRHLESKKLPPVDYAAFIASRVCRGLAYAHEKRDRQGRPLGIVHRDVTPANVMLDFRGGVKLSDFGIAKALDSSVPPESEVIMGKLPYMSPEQASGQTTDARSDIFSLGLVLFELLTGETVYQPQNRQELLRLMSEYRIVPPKRLRQTIPDDLNDIVMKSLEKKPEGRYGSARDLLGALEHYMYHDRYGPTNEKLAEYIRSIFPEIDRDRIE
jgi:serine/threonine-protein kinase